MACNTCTSGTPVCPYCWSLNFAPDTARPRICVCGDCGLSFYKPYCMSELTAQHLAAGEIQSPQDVNA